MPYISEKIKLPPEYDRRRKLTEEQKSEIRSKYPDKGYSLNSLAKEYGVSKKSILLIVNPDSKKKNDERIREHWRDYVPSKQEQARIKREYRTYKENLYKQGKISLDSVS